MPSAFYLFQLALLFVRFGINCYIMYEFNNYMNRMNVKDEFAHFEHFLQPS